jgi:hypothetical protein
MQPLKESLFEVLKHTRVQLNPGETIDIKYLLLEMKKRHLLSDEDVKEIMAVAV